MGKRKRSKDREYEKIMRKLRKLEEKTNKRRRIISFSSSDSEASSNPDLSQIPVNLDDESSLSGKHYFSFLNIQKYFYFFKLPSKN